MALESALTRQWRRSGPARHVSDDERRARLGRRQALAPSARAGTPEEATRAVVALHATEPASVHLSCWARVEDLANSAVERALYDDRSLVRQMAMRQTLFVFPRDLLPAAWGSAAARWAGVHGPRLARQVERGGVADDGLAWLTQAGDAVVSTLSDGIERSARQLRQQVPQLAGSFEQGAGTSWAGRVQLAPRVLTQLSLEARVARGHNAGPWRGSSPLWTTPAAWLGHDPEALPSREGYAELVRRWLRAFGPGTVEDLRWWLGDTKAAVRTALDDVGALEVSLDGIDGEVVGWLLPEDLEPVTSDEHWVALLPVLDPTVMGWRQRGFYLGPHAAALFDTIGNAGTTAWVDGQVVGAWVQDEDQVVRLRLLEEVTPAARTALEREATRLTAWLAGERAFPVYPSPAMRGG